MVQPESMRIWALEQNWPSYEMEKGTLGVVLATTLWANWTDPPVTTFATPLIGGAEGVAGW